MSAKRQPCPAPFLVARLKRSDLQPPIVAMCAGYELKKWRCAQLAKHLLEWLPEFALKQKERDAIGAHNAFEMVGRAARALYNSPKYKRRGEAGEILLHAILRQEFGTLPAISKFFYKDARNDTVKGFDSVHVIASQKRLELWLGEVKFYKDITRAIQDVTAELQAHTKRKYLRAEFAAITNKIDDAWPQAARLKKLIHTNTSLDKIFDAVCIPVLLTYESGCVGSFRAVTAKFESEFQKEVLQHHAAFGAKALPGNLRVHLLLVPLESKQALVDAFDSKLKLSQSLYDD